MAKWIVVLATGIVLLLLSLGLDREDPHAGVPSGGRQPEDLPIEPQGPEDPIERVSQITGPQDEGRASWRDDPDIEEKLLQEFHRLYITENGEEKQVQYVLDRTNDLKSTGRWNDVENAISAAQASGMHFSQGHESLFDDLLMPDFYSVSNMLHSQKSEFLRWQGQAAGGHVHFRSDSLETFPLNFPPEVHFAQISGVKEGWEYSDELLEAGSLVRDTAVKQYSAHILEEFILLQSMEAAAKQLDIEADYDEKESLFLAAIPQYRSVKDSLQEVDQGYRQALENLVASFSDEAPSD